MANIKSAKKRIRQTEARTLRNKIRKTMVKTSVRRFESALNQKDFESAELALRFCYARLDRAAQKGSIHRNAAARKKSRLTERLNKSKSESA